MAFALLPIVCLMLLSVQTNGAESPAEAYWKSKLGNSTPMPKVVKDGLMVMGSSRTKVKWSQLVLKVTCTLTYTCALTYSKERPTSDTNGLVDKSVLFFFEKELTHPKGKMMIRFTTSDEEAKFLPLKVSKSIPFSSNKLTEILNLFSVQPGTTNAKIAEATITLCEAKAIKGEQKSCATSLEDMVDFAVAHVGNNVKVVSTEVNKEALVEYKVESANKISNGVDVVCHKMSFPYAVFYCHTSEKTDAYVVSLTDANGKKVNAVAVCHKDTSSWNPNHLAFQVLNVKPGTVPICHFIYENTILWVPIQSINN